MICAYVAVVLGWKYVQISQDEVLRELNEERNGPFTFVIAYKLYRFVMILKKYKVRLLVKQMYSFIQLSFTL